MSSPFLCPQFKAWSQQVAKDGAKLACVLKMNTGDIFTYGDYEWGVKTFSEKINVKKRKSGEWIPDHEKLIKMTVPLSEKYKELNFVKLHAAQTLNLFLGPTGKYGEGENILWDFQVKFTTLTFTHDVLKNVWNSDVICLSDVIDWHNFKIRSFGTKPKSEFFKMHMSWRQMCLMIIEVGYLILNLDVNSPSTLTTPASSEVLPVASDGVITDMAGGESAGASHSVGGGGGKDVAASQDPPEKLRCVIPESDFIKPVLKQSFAKSETSNLTLQILEIIPDDNSTKIRLSDTEFWLEAKLNKKYESYMKTGLVKKHDIVNKVSLSSSDPITLDNFCRPKSIQLSSPRKLGMPLPLFQQHQIISRKVIRPGKPAAPRIPDLFSIQSCPHEPLQDNHISDEHLQDMQEMPMHTLSPYDRPLHGVDMHDRALHEVDMHDRALYEVDMHDRALHEVDMHERALLEVALHEVDMVDRALHERPLEETPTQHSPLQDIPLESPPHLHGQDVPGQLVLDLPVDVPGRKRKLSSQQGEIMASSHDLQARLDPSQLHEDFYHIPPDRFILNRVDPFNPDGFEDFDEILERCDKFYIHKKV